MSHGNSRKVFLVLAGGNPAAEKHFEGPIQQNRTLVEVRRFLPSQEIENLEKIYFELYRVGAGSRTNE